MGDSDESRDECVAIVDFLCPFLHNAVRVLDAALSWRYRLVEERHGKIPQIQKLYCNALLLSRFVVDPMGRLFAEPVWTGAAYTQISRIKRGSQIGFYGKIASTERLSGGTQRVKMPKRC